ncbi:MAG: 3-isopropylmalate dehydratase small subunit, partial [Bacteroidota bacterium]
TKYLIEKGADINQKTSDGNEIQHGDRVKVDFISGMLTNLRTGKTVQLDKFYDAQLAIYQNGGLL